jgi:hypothetical protein
MTFQPDVDATTQAYAGPERRRYDRRRGVPDEAWSYTSLTFGDRRQLGRRAADLVLPTSREELLEIAHRVLLDESELAS